MLSRENMHTRLLHTRKPQETRGLKAKKMLLVMHRTSTPACKDLWSGCKVCKWVAGCLPTPRNFETFTTKLETPSCSLTSTKLFQSANKLSRRLGKGLALTTKARRQTRTFFSHGLEPTRSRRLHSLTSCRLSLLLSVKLEAFSTA